MPNAARNPSMRTPNALTPTPAQFDMLRQTIDNLEKQSEHGARRGEGATRAARPAARSRRGHPMSDTTQAAQPGPARSNAITFAEMLLTADELGKEFAKGKDVQVKFDLKVMEAAFAGAIDTTKDKHGPGIDDFTKLAEAYYKGRNSTNVFDHKEGKQRKLASDLRTAGRLGASPKYGVGQPMQNVNDLVTLRQNLRRSAHKGVKLDDAHNMLMRYARTQLKQDTLITGDALKAFCFRSESDPREAQDVIRGWLNQAIKLRDGKLSNCAESDSSAEITTIINACNRRLTAIAKAKGDKQAA